MAVGTAVRDRRAGSMGSEQSVLEACPTAFSARSCDQLAPGTKQIGSLGLLPILSVDCRRRLVL